MGALSALNAFLLGFGPYFLIFRAVHASQKTFVFVCLLFALTETLKLALVASLPIPTEGAAIVQACVRVFDGCVLSFAFSDSLMRRRIAAGESSHPDVAVAVSWAAAEGILYRASGMYAKVTGTQEFTWGVLESALVANVMLLQLIALCRCFYHGAATKTNVAVLSLIHASAPLVEAIVGSALFGSLVSLCAVTIASRFLVDAAATADNNSAATKKVRTK